MLKVRVTQLETFRRFISDEPYATEEALLESFSGVFKGNEYTRIGTAFHKIVETMRVDWQKTETCGIVIDENTIVFSKSQYLSALQYRAEVLPCFFEVANRKTYQIESEEITVTGHCDVLRGLSIRDEKTKYLDLRSIEGYTRSYQWRLYCDMFEVPDFSYDVFQFVGYDKLKNGYDVSGLEIKRHDPIDCLAYSTMQQDIHTLLHEFKNYVHFKQIEKYFQ